MLFTERLLAVGTSFLRLVNDREKVEVELRQTFIPRLDAENRRQAAEDILCRADHHDVLALPDGDAKLNMSPASGIGGPRLLGEANHDLRGYNVSQVLLCESPTLGVTRLDTEPSCV
jgi:hypothetical protein